MPSLKYFDPVSQSYKYLVGQKPQDPLSGFRNVIRNGDMSIYQRGNGPFTNLNSAALIDGYWSNYAGGTFTINRVEQAVGSGSALIRCQVSGQALASHYAVLWPYIEDVSTLAGKTVTLSFNAFSASGLPQIGICIEQYFGPSASPTIDTPMGAVQISPIKKRYEKTFVMPSIAGKTIGANNCIYVGFYLSAGSNNASNASSIGIQNNTISLTDIQLEEGAVATPFERLPVQQQLAWCQRYFWRMGTNNPNVPSGPQFTKLSMFATSAGTTDVYAIGTHPVPMRAVPSATFSSPISNFQISSGNTPYTVTAAALEASTSATVFTIQAVSSSLVANLPLFFQRNGSAATCYVDFSAEL